MIRIALPLMLAGIVLLGAADDCSDLDLGLFSSQSVRIVNQSGAPLAIEYASSGGIAHEQFRLANGSAVSFPVAVGKAIVNAKRFTDADTRQLQQERDDLQRDLVSAAKAPDVDVDTVAGFVNVFALQNAYLNDLKKRSSASCAFDVKSDTTWVATFTDAGGALTSSCGH